MGLEYPNSWRFGAKEEIPDAAVETLARLVSRIAAAAEKRQSVFETFKRRFGATGNSSSASWAESDMLTSMNEFEGTQAAFVEAFWVAVCDLASDDVSVPSAAHVSSVVQAAGLPFSIEPPHLKRVATASDLAPSRKEPAEPSAVDAEPSSVKVDAPPGETPPFEDVEAVLAAVAHALIARERFADARLLADASVSLAYTDYDNWDGGTTSWTLEIGIAFEEYTVRTKKDNEALEKFVGETVAPFLPPTGFWCSAKIKPLPMRRPDWRKEVAAVAGAGHDVPAIRHDASAGDFVVNERLGAGAHGATYRGEQKSLGREVALKWLNPSAPSALVAADQARALAKARHDNVVVVHGLVRMPDPKTMELSDCIVMEFIRGKMLSEALSGGASHEELLTAADGIVAGIRHIHQVGLTHGDLHSENILLRAGDRRAIIIDLQYWGAITTATSRARSADIARDVRGLSDVLFEILRAALPNIDAALQFRAKARRAETLDAVVAAYQVARIDADDAPW